MGTLKSESSTKFIMLSSIRDDGEGVYTCFFYGTLMSVDILKRVIGTTSDHLEFADALLKNHTRHHVKAVDYPAVVPAKIGTEVLKRKLSDDEASVRGTVVKGLTKSDIRFLDTFEGDEYTRDVVTVDLLSAFKDADSKNDVTGAPSDGGKASIEAGVYLWTASQSMLEPTLWTFDEFMREKAHMWIGNGSDEAEYLEVDRRRQMEGKIVYKQSNGAHPTFGHAMKGEFMLEPGYINLNHGGLGALPKRVMEARRRWLDLYEAAPDKFWSNRYFPAHKAVKAEAAEFLHCESGNLAFVLNATTGVNTVLRSIRWKKRDHILYFPSASYKACYNTLLYLQDHYDELDIQLVPVHFDVPISHKEILRLTEETIEKTRASLQPGERLHLGLMDAICSLPGVVMPWVELCALFKKYDILSLVDAAHAMGHVPVDLTAADPDFWVSNAHKWCFAPRSLALLHVPRRNHHLVEALPVSFGYKTSKTPKTPETPSAFEADFSYNGTQDITNILSLSEAFDFRKDCGGEDRIMSYNHELCLEGAALLAERFGTEVMQNEEKSMIACMANIRLPIPAAIDPDHHGKIAFSVFKRLLDDFNISVNVFPRNGQVWVRVAAQIYNELSDFEALADATLEVLRDIDSLLG